MNQNQGTESNQSCPNDFHAIVCLERKEDKDCLGPNTFGNILLRKG